MLDLLRENKAVRADAAADRDLLENTGNIAQELRQQMLQLVRRQIYIEHYGKLVTADTADRAAETKGVLQMLGELLEDLITDRMAVFVVDVLEIIQITDQKPAGCSGVGLLAAETGVQEQPAAHNAGQEVQLAGVLTKFHVAVDHQDEDEQNEVERQHGSQKLHLQVENIPMDILCDIYAVLPEHVVHTAGEVHGREDRHTDMTHDRPIRLILLFSLPLMLGSVFQQLYTIVDTIIIGRGVGMQALASIGAADWINWLVLWGLQGFTQGFAILTAQEFGAGAYDRLRRVLAMIVKLSCWFGIAVTIISLLLVRPLLTLLHTDPAVFGGAQTYLYVQFGGSLIIIAYNMAAAVLRCLGDSRTPLFAIIAASFANIALDLLFVMGFGWGIFGASFATVLAQLIAFLLCLRSLRRLPFVQMTKADWKTDPAILLHLCRLGIPTGLQMSMITLGGMVLQSVLNGFGVVFVAGYTAANKLYGILESASVAFGYAMTAYMGQNRGARNAARIDAGIRAVLVLSAEFTAAIVTAMLLAGKPLLGLFLSTEEAGAADALAVAYRYLMVLMTFLFALFVLQAYRSSLQGLGEMTVPTLSGFAEMLMRMGAALVLPTFIGQSGVFFAEGAAWVCAAALNLVWYYIRIGKIKRDMLQ